jgi:hypothetical protein
VQQRNAVLFWSLLFVVMSVVSLCWYDGWMLLQLLTAWLYYQAAANPCSAVRLCLLRKFSCVVACADAYGAAVEFQLLSHGNFKPKSGWLQGAARQPGELRCLATYVFCSLARIKSLLHA